MSARGLRALARESLADALRRRIVPAIGLAALASLWLVDSCTSCSPNVSVSGRELPLPEVAGIGGVLVVVALAQWSLVLAGVLASDHLSETLADGSAALVLARPVGRGAFALARLAGVLALAWATAALLIGATAGLLAARQGLEPWPALGSLAACMTGAVVVAALAMSASLALPRVATALLCVVGVGVVGSVNAASLLGVELGGAAAVIDRFGPPLLSGALLPLAAWLDPAVVAGDPAAVALRLALWAAASVALLVALVRRIEIAG
jgi:hypothetical protein